LTEEGQSWASLRRAFAAAGYDEAAVANAVREAPSAEAVPLAVRRGRSSGVNALMRLFMLEETVQADRLPVPVESLERAGLVKCEGESVRARARLMPHEGLLLASDPTRRANDRDYVPGIQNASLTLTALTIRKQVERALDVGAGFGLQALLAARHAREVVATDINPRGLRYTELNSRLNGLSIETRAGSWFDPVDGESFDLVVANPPFVISPENRQLFRDSELGGEGVSREVTRAAVGHIREGGHATVLANWIYRETGEPWEPLREWVQDSGCDVLLLANEPITPLQYSAQWNEALRFDRATFERAVERWLDHFDRLGARGIGFGAIVLRRRPGRNWCRGLRMPVPATGQAGRHLERLFLAQDEPPPEQDGDLLQSRFRLVSGHRLRQDLVYRDQYEIGNVAMTLDDGIGLVAFLDARVLPVLFALDGRRLGEILTETGVEPEVVAPVMRRLYEDGFLELDRRVT
jgi:methylase of polypeptide subunit release factors